MIINRKNPKIFITSTMVLCFLSSCGSKSFLSEFVVRNFSYQEFDKKNLITEVSKNVIIPQYADFKNTSTNLENKIKTLTDNPNNENLLLAQNAWKDLIASWQRTESFQFGPVKDLNIANKIYFWPIKEASIKEVITKDKNTLTNNYLDSVGVAKKGIPVIEYLIFNKDGKNDLVIDSIKKSETIKRYLNLLTNDLKNNAISIDNEWNQLKGNYSLKLSNESNAFNMLLNNMIATLEDIKDKKIDIPLGKKSGGEIKPLEVESPFSNNSKNNIISNLEGLKILFQGSLKNTDQTGLDDYLEYVEKQNLKDTINSQITKTIDLVKTINSPLSIAVEKENTKVESVHNELKELLRLIKVDVAIAVNETVHFNSSDGD